MDASGSDRRELFIFPDGTAVEVIVFDPAPGARRVGPRRQRSAPAAPPPQRPAGDASQLQAPPPFGTREEAAPSTCPGCGSDLLYPVDWERNRDGDWNLRLRCPNCEAQRHIVLGREGVEALNRTLYHHAQALAREADTVSRRYFEEEAAKLVEALHRDLILPMDF